MILKGKLSYNFPKHLLGVFHNFSHHGRSTFFCCTFTSLNSISEPNNPVCVLGAINEHYEVLCDVRMYVSLCLKLSVNYGQMVAVFVFFHETQWIYKVLRILYLKGQQICLISSKVTAILPQFFQKKNQKSQT